MSDKIEPAMERDPVTGLPIPHLSYILRNFLPMYHNCDSRQMLQDNATKEWGTVEGVETELLATGSLMEGLNLPCQIHGVTEMNKTKQMMQSDFDQMLILKNKLVCDPENVERLSKDGVEVMEIYTNGIHPGYMQTRVHNSKLMKNHHMFVEKEGDEYLYYAPLKAKDMITEDLPTIRAKDSSIDFEQTGPSLASQAPYKFFNQDIYQEGDFIFPVFCCPIWPNIASNWKTRERPSNWPSADLVKEIVSKGCHIVPVFHTSSNEPELEWRTSFSVAELMLMRHINRTQRQCYLLLKCLHSWELKQPKALVSYHLKTMFLWMCEMIPQEEWNPDNVGPCLMKMLDHLHQCLSDQNLPSYFIPENNLIDRIPEELCDELALRVLQIRKDPLRYLFEFNKKLKWFFGLFWQTAEKLFHPILEDAESSTSLVQSHQRVFFVNGCMHAVNHLLEHGALLKKAMETDQNPEPGEPSYTLPYDNALDILEDTIRMHKNITGEDMEVFKLVLLCASNISEYTDSLCGFYERFLERYPDDPNRNIILGNLGCCYHVKYLRKLSPERKKEIQNCAVEVFNKSLGNGAGSATQVDYALFLCAIEKKEAAVEILRGIMELALHETEGKAMDQNAYGGPELLTIDENIRQISECQKTVSVFSCSLAAYLLVKLAKEEEVEESVKNFQNQCELLLKFKKEKQLGVGNAFVLLGYACELAGCMDEAEKAHITAAELLPVDKMPELHIKPQKQPHVVPWTILHASQVYVHSIWQRIATWLGFNR